MVFKALEIPNRIAPACPVNPPPLHLFRYHKNLQFLTSKGCVTIVAKESLQNNLYNFSIIIIFPEPDFKNTCYGSFSSPVPYNFKSDIVLKPLNFWFCAACGCSGPLYTFK